MSRGGRHRFASFTALVGAVALAALTAQTALAVHAVFDNNPFTSGSDVVTGFSSGSSTVCNVGGLGNQMEGPVGLLNDGTHFFVDDLCAQTLYRLPATGGVITSSTPHLKNGLTGGLTKVGSTYYGLIQNKQFPAPAPGGRNAGLYSFNPTTLAVTYIVSFTGDSTAAGTHDRGVAGDPAGKNLYVSTDHGIFKVTLPGHVVTRFDKCTPPKTSPPCSGNFDGITLSTSGAIVYAADPQVNSNLVEFNLTGTPTHATQIAGGVKEGSDGIVVAPPGSTPNGKNVSGNVFINTNDGHVQRYTGPGSVSEAARGGTRGDLATTDPKGCVYVTQTGSIEKLLPCLTGPNPSIPEVPALPLVPLAGGLAIAAFWRGRRLRVARATPR